MPNFPGINANAIFSDAWAPGAQGFNSAINFYQRLLNTNGAGAGLPALATGRVQSGVGANYQATPYNPSQNAGIGAYDKLVGGESEAAGVGGQAQDQTQQAAIQGATNTANAYGNSLISHIQGTIAQNAAESQANAGGIDIISTLMNGIFGKGGIGQSLIGSALGPSGASMASSGPASFLADSGSSSDIMSMLTALAAAGG